MINEKMLEEVKKRLIKTYDPLKIYVFGSYAWGNPTEESDLDLVIIVDKKINDHYRALVEGHKALVGLDLAKDIMLFTKEDFEVRSNNKSTLCYQIKHKGKQIYARA